MAYKNTLKDYLKFEKELEDEKKIKKEFSCEFPVKNSDSEKEDNNKETKSEPEIAESKKEDLSNSEDLNPESIANYIQVYYLDEDKIEKGKLVNDLIAFKAFKSSLEIMLGKIGFFMNGLTIFIAICGSVLTVKFGDNSQTDKMPCYFYLGLGILGIAILYVLFLLCKRNTITNNLNTVNNSIYILEALKAEMVEENKISDSDESKECKGLNETSSDKPNVNPRKGKDKDKSNKRNKENKSKDL